MWKWVFICPRIATKAPKQRKTLHTAHSSWVNEASTISIGLTRSDRAMLALPPLPPCYERGTGMWRSLDQVSSTRFQARACCLTALSPLGEFLERLEVTWRLKDMKIGISFHHWHVLSCQPSRSSLMPLFKVNAFRVPGGVSTSQGSAYNFLFSPRISKGLGMYLNKRV